jgi:two-component system, NtrC family, response regulator HydG
MTQAHVLIVDDDRDLAKSLANFVELHGHQVTIASNGQEAVERFRERDFDIAFMDVCMPVMNGADSFLEIRRLRPTARVMLMTGFREPVVDQALESGALGLLLKPFHVTDLLARIQESIDPTARVTA